MVGIQFDWRLKKARFSISIAPLKTRPALNAASAAATTGVWLAGEGAALVEQADDRLGEHGADDRRRDEQERDLPRDPRATVAAKPAQVAARGEARERREEHGRDRDREHPLREHVDQERLLDRGRREVGSMNREAKNVSISALTLISPSPSVTGIISLKTCAHGRVAPVDDDAQPLLAVSSPRSHGIGSSTWMNVATRIEPA